MALMPPVLGGIFNYMRPDLVGPMMEHIFGYVLLAVVVLMEFVGVLLIRRNVNVDG